MKKDNQHNDCEYYTGYTVIQKYIHLCWYMMVEGIHLDKDSFFCVFEGLTFAVR